MFSLCNLQFTIAISHRSSLTVSLDCDHELVISTKTAFCCAMFCCATFCCVTFCCVTFCCVTFCCATFCHATFCRATFSCARFCRATFCRATIGQAIQILLNKNALIRFRFRCVVKRRVNYDKDS
jgi:hypothetical protein